MANKVINFFVNGFSAIKIRNKQDLKNIYRGDVPLVYMFWMFSLYILPVELISKYIDYRYANTPYEQVSAQIVTLSLILLATQIAFMIFNSIATWRSANKYTGRRLWRWLTKISITLVMMIGIVSIFIGFAAGVSEYTNNQMLLDDNGSNTVDAYDQSDFAAT